MKATFKDGKKFLSEISSRDKVAVVCDNDLDGFSSGILFYNYAKSRGAKVKSFVIDAAKSQDGVVKQMKKFNKVIITDLGSNKISSILETVKEKDVFYTDHHPPDNSVPKKILEYRTLKGGNYPSSRAAQELTGIERWRGLAGTMSDMGHRFKVNDKYIKDSLKELGMTQKKFLENVVFPSNGLITYFYRNPQRAFQLFAKMKDHKEIKNYAKYTELVGSEIQKHIKLYKSKKKKMGRASYYYFNPKYPVKSAVTTIISLKAPTKIFLFATPYKDKIKISSRCQSGKVMLNELLSEATRGFKNSKAGGHPRASGAVIMKKDLKQFKKNIAELTKKL